MAPYSAKDYSRLIGTQGFSNALLTQHFELYNGYVKSANALHDEINAALPGKPPAPHWSELKRRFGWEWNGMRLHEMYFSNLTKERKSLGKAVGLEAQISRDFGSRETWEKEFRATGSLRGIGWAALVWDTEASRLFNIWIDEHDHGQLAGCPVLLLMDVFEHAYMPDYGTKRADYIDAFLAAADWDLATHRFETAGAPVHKAAHA